MEWIYLKKMKYLNLGCGIRYSNEEEWTNLDFVSSADGIIAHNLLKGIPFQDNYFDFVYHSHLLEHFSKDDGEKLIEECFRVLKSGGILRIAIPDIEIIIKKYLSLLEEGIDNPENKLIKANYDWMMIELFDQTVRNQSGGRMGKCLSQKTLLNEDFVFERIGEEARKYRKNYLLSSEKQQEKRSFFKPRLGIRIKMFKIKLWLKNRLFSIMRVDQKSYQIGKFRLSGEIHQWMYDRYSLTCLLQSCGGNKIQIRDAFTSYMKKWEEYSLDGIKKIVRKPDSLFIEAIK